MISSLAIILASHTTNLPAQVATQTTLIQCWLLQRPSFREVDWTLSISPELMSHFGCMSLSEATLIRQWSHSHVLPLVVI